MEEPAESGERDHVYISKSYDASSHFETVCDDVKDLYFRITKSPLNAAVLGNSRNSNSG